jgi:DNA-binding FrmR family transcriptional regulator
MTEHTHAYTADKENLLKRMRRIEGQVAGIARMIDDERYCIDVLTQVAAVTSALQSVSLELLDAHLAGCVVEAARRGGPEAEAKVAEASQAIARLVRK